MSYYDLHIAVRAGLCAGLFVLLCASISVIPSAARRRGWGEVVAVLTCSGVSFYMMILYASDMKTSKMNWQMNPRTQWLCSQPLGIPLLIMAGMTAVVIAVYCADVYYRKHTLTPSSIRQSLDLLPSGLCFAHQSGQTVLVNHRMHQLSHIITGMDIQDAEAFWQTLCSGTVSDGVHRVMVEDCPSFTLPDGTTWTFARQNLEGFVQLTAANTTLLQSVARELKEKNMELAAMNQRLRDYNENMEDLVRANERLEIKANVHRGLGQALLATRQYLLDETGEKAVPLAVWRNNIAMLHKQAQTNADENPMEMLMRAAAGAGITVEMQGRMPQNPKLQKLFFEAATEALTNAVRHAGATALRIGMRESEGFCSAVFTNNGAPPDGPVAEGGGLSAVRRKTEQMGGTMTICTSPSYVLSICIKKEAAEHDSRSDRRR